MLIVKEYFVVEPVSYWSEIRVIFKDGIEVLGLVTVIETKTENEAGGIAAKHQPELQVV